jgi:hypothetical protein
VTVKIKYQKMAKKRDSDDIVLGCVCVCLHLIQRLCVLRDGSR